MNHPPTCPCVVAPYRVGPLGDRCGARCQPDSRGYLTCEVGHVFEATPGEVADATRQVNNKQP